MFLRVLIAVAMLPTYAHAQTVCAPGKRCVMSPAQRVIVPRPINRAPQTGPVLAPKPGTVKPQPQVQAPQPPAQAPSAQRITTPRPQSATGNGGSEMITYICQTQGAYCRLNSFEVIPSGKTCHCRGVLGKIK